jgi:microsomal dipeptidase-like Zn-dependent dipeptidase
VWDGLVARGYANDDVEKTMGRNQYRIYQQVIG